MPTRCCIPTTSSAGRWVRGRRASQRWRGSAAKALLSLVFGALLALIGAASHAAPALQTDADGPAVRAVYIDPAGVVRWRDTQAEVRLYGANYCIMSGSDFRMAGLVAGDRKAMIDEDLAQFARMGWTALRLCSWGDWENADRAGNLLANDHLDLLDYLIAKARERGIYLLLTPIHTYDPAFADRMGKPTTDRGFSRYYPREKMGTDPSSIAAQANYIGQLLEHVNPYTGVALKDEPAILFIELINEPVHHPEDRGGSVAYIDRLVGAVRATGCSKPTFFNVSQDFAIGAAIRDSTVDGVSFGWYPSGLVAGRQLQGNFLQAVDSYPDMLRPELRGKPRIVYEFDQADLLTGYLYPAMARTFRSVGAQFATMFAYDMLRTAPYNLGWQTHYLNLVHTPRKAISAVIAAEAMRRLPAYQDYGRYPDNRSFGDFRVDYESDSSLLDADDAFMNAGTTTAAPRKPAALRRIAGFGSSGAIGYEGTGAYFLDKLGEGLWRLEVYPDEVLVHDPFEQPRPDRIVSRLLNRAWPMTVRLPDLGEHYTASALRLAQGKRAAPRSASGATFRVEPGVWLLSRGPAPEPATLPPRVARVGLDEYHVNEPVSYPDSAQTLAPRDFPAGAPVAIRVQLADDTLPDAVQLWMRPAGRRDFDAAIAMERERGDVYVGRLAADALLPGLYEYVVSVRTGERTVTFPGGRRQEPGNWPFHPDAPWSLHVVAAGTPLRLFDAGGDFDRLSFVRPGEQYRGAYFRITQGSEDYASALRLDLPDLGRDTPQRYAAALYVGDAVAARPGDASGASALEVVLRAEGGTRKTLEVELIERDGTAWRASVVAGPDWATVRVPLEALRASLSIHIPSPYPGLWNYWRAGAVGRGAGADRIRAGEIERLQLAVERSVGDDAAGVSIQSVSLRSAAPR